MEGIEQIDVEVGMTTHHHNKGDVFLCRVNVTVGGELFRVEREEEDLYKAIDKVRDHLRETLAQAKKRREDKRQSAE
jgi:ribosomal subunit interface protein